MNRVRFEGLTEAQTETLIAIGDLNKRSSAFKTVEEVARQRLTMRGWGTREMRKRGSYFGMYVTSSHKLLEELSRRGYVDQSEKPAKTASAARPYKITKRGKEKLKREVK
jgi:hypothetical protein